MDRPTGSRRVDKAGYPVSRPVDRARRNVLAGSVAALLLPLLPSSGAAGEALVPTRRRGSTQRNVRTLGAAGDGVTDDTAAIQRAVDSLPAGGGTVVVPAGKYCVDPLRSLRLRSNMHLHLADGATLMAIPNAAPRAYVVLIKDVSDVEVSGGQVIGDRDAHLGTTGEWGYGITVRGSCSRVTLRDLKVSRCWGDGICVGSAHSKPTRPVDAGNDIVIARVICTGNRRQGLTIARARNVRVYDSEFSDTSGTAPSAGIDIEPDFPDGAQDILIQGCRIRGNRGPGIQVYKRVKGVVIDRCTITGNKNVGVLVVDAADTTIRRSTLSSNGQHGIALQGHTEGVRISGNVIRGNARRTLGGLLGGSTWKSQIRVGDDARAIRLDPDNVGG
jgi:parallel beta-helix repeat protein